MAAEYKAKAEVDRAMMDLNKPMSEKNSDIAEALAAVGWLSTALEWKDLVGYEYSVQVIVEKLLFGIPPEDLEEIMNSIPASSCQLIREILRKESCPNLEIFAAGGFQVESRRVISRALHELRRIQPTPELQNLIIDLTPLGNASVISAFPGMGKTTYFQRNYRDCLDSDSSAFSWISLPEGRQRNLEFPANYIEHIKQNISLGFEYIFISSHKEVRDALYSYNGSQARYMDRIPFKIFYPSIDRKEEFLELYKERGSTDSFIKLVEDNWHSWISELESSPNATKVYSGFLGDILEKNFRSPQSY